MTITHDDKNDPFIAKKVRGFEKTKSIVGGTLPTKATRNSAGYDFVLQYDLEVLPGEHSIASPLGVKAYMKNTEVLTMFVRSSLGFKHGIVLSNGTGIIDADYYNNSANEGEIFIKLYNTGSEPIILKRGTTVVQGIFMNTLPTDDNATTGNKRIGGIGSTMNKV